MTHHFTISKNEITTIIIIIITVIISNRRTAMAKTPAPKYPGTAACQEASKRARDDMKEANLRTPCDHIALKPTKIAELIESSELQASF